MALKYIDVDWESVMSQVQWVEFNFRGGRFRAGEYFLEGDSHITAQKYLGAMSPHSSGWVGYRWFMDNTPHFPWPPTDTVKAVLTDPQKAIMPAEDASVTPAVPGHVVSRPVVSI